MAWPTKILINYISTLELSIWRNWEMERGEEVLRFGGATFQSFGRGQNVENQSDLTKLIKWFNARNFLPFF